MRVTTIAAIMLLLAAGPSAAQTQALPPEPHPYGLDPSKPSDAALLRTYGSTLVAQTPLVELGQLDPYKPSHAALLRQLGGGLPLWSHLSWYPTAQPPAPLMLVPPQTAIAAAPGQNGVTVIIVQPEPRPVAPQLLPPDRRPPIPVAPAPQPVIPPLPEGPLRASVQR